MLTAWVGGREQIFRRLATTDLRSVTSTGRPNIMGLYLGECVRISRKSTVLLALALLEPLVLIPDPILATVYDDAHPKE